MSLEDLTQATCAINIDGRRQGTGTLVTPEFVLTAAHVLRRAGRLEVQFLGDSQTEPLSGDRLTLSPGAEARDVAVVRVSPRHGSPEPAKLSPAKRLPKLVKTFGYPKGEGRAPRGVWRDSTVSGRVQDGRIQLDWTDVGTLVGHSGGPVCDAKTGYMVGVLVEGSEAAHFDRFVPLTEIRRIWPTLPTPWLFAGENALGHFRQRAAGQRSIARGGDLFRGRSTAVRVIEDWLGREASPGVPLVLTGQPGCGKSAVLGRAALALEARAHCDGLAFHARRATIDALLDALSAGCGLTTPVSWQQLAGELAEINPDARMIVVIDALDEAASTEDRVELRRAVREYARLDWLRIAVATRALVGGDPIQPGTHLYGLGVTGGATSRNLVDLDSDEFFCADDVAAYASALLSQSEVARPGPQGAAWESYRADPRLCERLARVITERAQRNFLVAGMAAFPLAEAQAVLDPASAKFDPGAIPAGVGEALTKFMDGLSAPLRRRVAALLSALAYSRGAGLTDLRWLAFAAELGGEGVSPDNLAELRESAAADLLLETTVEGDGSVTRLFHQALADELLSRRNRRDDERRIVRMLEKEASEGGWLATSAYARRHAPSHAATAGLLETLLDDPAFLVAMAPTSLRAAIRTLDRERESAPAAIYDVALPVLRDNAGENASLLGLVSQTQRNAALSLRLGDLAISRPYRVSGNLRPFDTSLARFDGHTDVVWSIAAVSWPTVDHSVLVTTSSDATARIWDPYDPENELARFDRHTDRVLAVATLAWPELDHDVMVTTSSDGTARVWDPRRPDVELTRFDAGGAALLAVTTLPWPELDHRVVVTTAADGTARIWDPHRPERELARFVGHTDEVWDVKTIEWPSIDHPVLVTVSHDKTACIWDPHRPDVELARFTGHTNRVWGVAALSWPNREYLVVVTTSLDGTARVWDPRQSGRELAQFDAHTNELRGVTTIAWPGLDHRVIVTTSSDATARIWDPHSPDRELARFDGHSNQVLAVMEISWPGLSQPAIATTSLDGIVRIWDPQRRDIRRTAFAGHTNEVWGVTPVPVRGLDHPAIVTASHDGTARIWDPERPETELARFDGHSSRVWGAATLPWPGLDHPVIATASHDKTARVWDPQSPGIELARLQGHTDAVWGVTTLPWSSLGRPLIVTTSHDNTARVWDPHDATELARFEGHSDGVWRAIGLWWPSLEHNVVVTTSLDGTARIWDPERPERELACFAAHTDQVLGVVTYPWPGLNHPVVVTTSHDRTARVWDPLEPGDELARFDRHSNTVLGVTLLSWDNRERPVLVTTSNDGSARIWDPQDPDVELLRLPLLGQGHAAVAVGPSGLAVATNRGYLVFEFQRT